MTFVTIFTAPKPFTNPHIAVIQWNAIRSWQQLGSEVDILVLGEEAGLAELAEEMRIRHLPAIARNSSGTPLVSAMFALARQLSDSPFLACVNADIILLPEVVLAIQSVAEQLKDQRFLIVGQRWDLAVRQRIDFNPGWEAALREQVKREGRLHPRGGSDYFIFPRDGFIEMPDFAIGRAGWDNWMIYEARRQGWAVIDATHDLCIVHQDHDYSHLPNGQPHYRLPETAENVRLAGGALTIFTLLDANRRLVNGRVRPAVVDWQKFWREVEIVPLVGLRSRLLGWLFYAVFHPVRAYREFRKWLATRSARVQRDNKGA